MTFYSHSKTETDGIVRGSKHVKVHTKGVLENALFHHSSNCDLGCNDKELVFLIQTVVRFHDLGKYTSYFQNYLLKRHPIDGVLKQHARIGGLAAYSYLKQTNEKHALLALFVIFLHHSHLIDIQQIAERLNDDLARIISLQEKDLRLNMSQIEAELELKGLSDTIVYPDEKPIRRGYKTWALRTPSIRDYYLTNYLFSVLIEADKLDASDTAPYALKPIKEDAVDKRFGKPHFNSDPGTDLSQISTNALRTYCRSQVVANLNRKDILNRFLFTLTSPTGTGKTMAALDFAIKLKAKIRKENDMQVRLIYALPFINIIEQALKEYKETLPKETTILAHYQYADVFSVELGRPNEDGAQSHYNQKLMAHDTWQSDVVITSFVQFFQTLIGNQNKLLKKFNHFANSIIILDEVQTLRLDQMPLIGAALFYLSKFLKARIILMTATKPKIFQLASDQILSKEGDTPEPLELLSSHREVFAAFSRTKIVPLLQIGFDKQSVGNDFIDKAFAVKWSCDKSCIIVCNTVRKSIEIYEALTSWLTMKGFRNRTEYLSTNIIPAERYHRIHTLNSELRSGKATILVATQVVEAGVDLDFDMGFRDIGPVDSIIQVAGRINRNSNKEPNAPLFIVDLGDAQTIYGRITYDQAKSALNKSEVKEADYINLVDTYFDAISDRKSFARFNQIFESMKTLKYDSDDIETDRPVSAFKVIEESYNTQAVFIEIGKEEILLREKYLAKIKREISKATFDSEYKLEFQQRIVSIPLHLCKELPFINQFDSSLRVVSNAFVDQYYDGKTGFRRSNDNAITFL